MECEIRAKREGSMPTKRSRNTSKRTVIQPRKGDRRYVRRNKAGQFKKEVSVGRSLAADRLLALLNLFAHQAFRLLWSGPRDQLELLSFFLVIGNEKMLDLFYHCRFQITK